jgi:two-component system response regulator FixJ
MHMRAVADPREAKLDREMEEASRTSKASACIVYVVDDDELMRATLENLLEASGYAYRSFEDGAKFLQSLDMLDPGVILLDVKMPKVDGIEVLKSVPQHDAKWPTIVMSGQADIAMAVEAMRLGAQHFIEKPFSVVTVLKAVEETAEQLATGRRPSRTPHPEPLDEVLTEREMQVLRRLVQGQPNKLIARELSISPRTVEVHRANIMRRLNAGSFADVIRIAVQSGIG